MQPEEHKEDQQQTAYFSANAEKTEASIPEQVQPQAQEAKTDAPETSNMQVVQWQASEYHYGKKSPLWYAIFVVVAIAFVAAAVLLFQSVTFAVLSVVMMIALAIYAQRPPRLINYTLDDKGLHVDNTLHTFGEYKAFGVIHDGEEYSVTLIPRKRFSLELKVFFPEASGEAIVDVFGGKLPMMPLKVNVFDKVTRFLGI